jgi:hypothetical protein
LVVSDDFADEVAEVELTDVAFVVGDVEIKAFHCCSFWLPGSAFWQGLRRILLRLTAWSGREGNALAQLDCQLYATRFRRKNELAE